MNWRRREERGLRITGLSIDDDKTKKSLCCVFRLADWQKQHNAPLNAHSVQAMIIALVVPFYTTVLNPIYGPEKGTDLLSQRCPTLLRSGADMPPLRLSVLDGSPVDQLTNYIMVQVSLQKTGSYQVKFIYY